MDAIGADGQSDIDAIVDDERHARAPSECHQRPRLLDQRPRLGHGIAQLDHRRSAGQRLPYRLDRAARAAEFAVGDQIDREVETLRGH